MTDKDAIDRRMRCYGHILNLVGRAFLYGEDSETFEQESQVLDLTDRLDDDLRHWRKKGPIGKLRNIIKFIRSSPQRSERLKQSACELDTSEGFTIYEPSTRELEVIINNNTRWNSTYMMIDRALTKQTHLQTFLIENKLEDDPQSQIPEDDILSSEDWRLLVEIKEILEPLYLQTMRCQGWGKGDSHGRLWEIITGLEYLLDHFEDSKTFFTTPANRDIQLSQSQSPIPHPRKLRYSQKETQLKQSSNSLPRHTRSEYSPSNYQQQDRRSNLRQDSHAYLQISITNAWQKLNDYYIKLGDSPLFAAAVILHPNYSLRWQQERWNGKEQLIWLYDAKKGLEDFWERWYHHDIHSRLTEEYTSQKTNIIATQSSHEDSRYQQWLNRRTIRLSDDSSELDRYFRLDLPQRVDDPVQWWISHQASFPTLSKLALDIFEIPAMAADCERAFSLAKLTLTSQRLSMSSSTLEKVQCLKNWMRRGAVSIGDFNFVESIPDTM
ncbi:hypothetical protein VHEMI10679 [[Torrubiella] hemipterigena]|uniref:HAT C-terminal dimerisation domain-containing protein n=1 Tax=[Torrubiella] hemipterigena TaxID=1531966 RepID=A0A0A1TTM7_9HYPO|nr:hypothetical protein VHEMI10679 [[Torrubiella] hemipterigena]